MTAQELARAYWDSEESRDLGRILEHFEPTATWRGPGSDFAGSGQFRAFYEASIAGYPRLEVTIVEVLGDLERAALRWSAKLWDHDDREFGLEGVNFMTWRDGRIVDLATFFDPTPLAS